MAKRKVEIFSAGCGICEEIILLIKKLACSSCEVEVLNMQDDSILSRSKELGVHSVPAVAVDGKLVDCCAGAGPKASDLIAAGVGQPL